MTPAVRLLERAGVRHRLLEYEADPAEEAYGLAAARSLGQDPARVFKTLLFDCPGSGLAVAIIPVAGRLDLKAAAAAVGAKKAQMADPRAAERATGYVVGGISPLGQKKRLPTVLDASASAFETIFVSAGKRGLEIELAPADLESLTRARIARLVRESGP